VAEINLLSKMFDAAMKRGIWPAT